MAAKAEKDEKPAIDASSPDAEEQQLPPCIIVIPEQTEDGLKLGVQTNGFSLMETPTLLALAKKQVEEKLGI